MDLLANTSLVPLFCLTLKASLGQAGLAPPSPDVGLLSDSQQVQSSGDGLGTKAKQKQAWEGCLRAAQEAICLA